MRQYNTLCEELPYWEIESQVLNTDSSISQGLEITPLDIDCFDNEKVNQLTIQLRSFVNTIPEGLTAQLLVSTDSDFSTVIKKHKELLQTNNEFLISLEKFREERIFSQIDNNYLQRSRIYFFLKTPTPKVKLGFSLKSSKHFSKKFSKDFGEKSRELQETLLNIKSSLASIGFEAKDLSKDKLIQLIYQYLNPRRSKDIAPPNIYSPTDIETDMEVVQIKPELASSSPRSQIVFGDLILDNEDFVLDSHRTRVLTLKTLPEFTLAGQMKSFLKFGFHYDLLFTFQVADQAKEMKRLEQRRRMAHSLSQAKSGQVSDLESESRLSATENLIREIIETGQRIFVAELSLILREDNTADGKKRLNQKTREVLGRFKALSGTEAMQETIGAWKVFKSNLPAAPIHLERGKRIKTNNLVDFIPLYGPRLGDASPVNLLYDRQGSLIGLNPYDASLSNFNFLLTGSSGAGKSFFNNTLLLEQIARGTKCFIIDIGGSYQKLTSLLGGQYFDVSLSEKYAINPFFIPNIAHGPTSEKIKALSSIIEQMISDKDDKLSKLEKVLIERTLAETFEKAKHIGKAPTLSNFKVNCENSPEPELQRIAKLLYSWVGNTPYGKLLDRNGSFSTDKSVITFDLKGLSQFPDLQSVMILIITNFILDQVESDRSISKRIILDEAWQHLQSPAASAFMEYAARTFRKTGSGITFITQAIDEIIASPIASAILNNTAMKVVMQQRGDINILRETLKLNSHEISLIQSLEQRKGVYSEGFLIEGDHRQVIRIYPTPMEYWVSTSDARDNLYLQKMIQNGQSLLSAIKTASSACPFGVAQKELEIGASLEAA